MRATRKYENKSYFKTLVRFKKEDEEKIRMAAGKSLNGFIVDTVMEKVRALGVTGENQNKSDSEPTQEEAAAPEALQK